MRGRLERSAIHDDDEPSQEQVERMFTRARERWPHADDRSIGVYVGMKLDGDRDHEAQVAAGFADPSY